MRLIVIVLVLAIVIGYASGGRLAGLTAAEIRWPWLALVGVALQLVPGSLGIWALYASFVALGVFVLVNARVPGFALVLVGLTLNFVVIAVNRGMPVTHRALVESDQANTYRDLVQNGGSKHHIATDGDTLVVLGDSIPLAEPIRQTVSVGDLIIYAGGGWFVIGSMRRARPHRASKPQPEVAA